MKKVIFSLLVWSSIAIGTDIALAQQPLASNAKQSTNFIINDGSFTWAETSFDFGKIKANVPVTHEFSFTNGGDSPLVVTSVQASCGCTVAKYSKDPIGPGSKGYVTATYNAARVGVFTKTITVNANTGDGAVVLTVKGEVVE